MAGPDTSPDAKTDGSLPVEMNRRRFVSTILLAAFGAKLAGCVDCREEKPPEERPQGPRPPILQCENTTRKAQFEALKETFPQIAENPHLLFAIEDERVYGFLECSSLDDLKQLGILKNSDQPLRYMDMKKNWERAVNRNKDRIPYRDRLMRAKNEKVSYGYIEQLAAEGIQKFSSILGEAGLANDFAPLVTPEMILAICVQEVAPGELPGKIKIMPKARLELMRMMCEAGWQPQKMPALYDPVISFGLGQMTLPTHEGLQRGYGTETRECCIEKSFIHHTTSEQQVLNVLLLTYSNLESFSNLARKCPNFLSAFEGAPDEKKRRFLTTIIAAYHNYGNRKSLRRRLLATLQENFSTLEEYRMAFIASIRGLTIAYSHAKNSGTLYSFVLHRADRPAPEDTKQDKEPSEPPPELGEGEREEEDIIDDTLLVQRKRLGLGREGLAYYTFTVPNIELHALLHEILAPGFSLADIKKFQQVSFYRPGDIIHIPLPYLKPALRDRHFSRIPIQGRNVLDLMERYMEGGKTATNWHLALLYGTNDRELRFPAGLMKE